MATTAAQLKNLILIRLGDHQGSTPLSAIVDEGDGTRTIDVLWDTYADKAEIPNGARLQYLYTLRESVSIMLGVEASGMLLDSGIRQIKAGEQRQDFQKIYENTQAEIDTLEKKVSALRGPSVGLISQVAPIEPDDLAATRFAPNPNSRRYKGDPLLRPYWRRGG
jgi:hypothetical protein